MHIRGSVAPTFVTALTVAAVLMPSVPVSASTSAPRVLTTQAERPGPSNLAQPRSYDGDFSVNDPYVLSNAQWEYPRLNYDALAAKTLGAGRSVAVLDTGVMASNPDLVGQILPGVDFTRIASTNTADESGEGTVRAGVIVAKRNNGIGFAGIAPAAKVFPIKVVNARGQALVSDLVSGIVWAADHNADAITLPPLVTDDDDPYLHDAVKYAVARGVVVVVETGNWYPVNGKPQIYPGAYPEVLAVSGTDWLDHTGSHNSRQSIDVAAPGSSIASTGTGTDGVGYTLYGAAAHVAGLVADLRAVKPDATVAQITAAVESSATDLGPAGLDVSFGHGLIDPVKAVDKIATMSTTPHPTSSSTTMRTKTTVTVKNVRGRTWGNLDLGMKATVCVKVVDAATGAGVKGARVTVNFTDPKDSSRGGGFEAVTDSLGRVCRLISPDSFRVWLFATTWTSPGHYFGSGSANSHGVLVQLRPTLKTKAKARIVHRHIRLTVSPNVAQDVDVQIKTVRRWKTIAKRLVNGVRKLKLPRHKHTYRVVVHASGRHKATTSNVFRG